MCPEFVAPVRAALSMNIFIDESGTFVSTDNEDSWNCVVAYFAPEMDTRKFRAIISSLKRKSGFSTREEIKLKDIEEKDYFDFLSKLIILDGVLFSVATDSGNNFINNITEHQKDQVEKIISNVPRMHHQNGKIAVKLLGEQLSVLSPQLYVQLHCQICLIYDVLNQGVLYFVQRFPRSLSNFRWRIDQKNTKKIVFEEVFEKITPALLQSRSLREPMIKLKGADYSAMKKYEYEEGKEPTYLKDEYGIDVSSSAFNLGKLTGENLRFEDSKSNLGVQIADLLASGIRRCLRNQFMNNEIAAKLLGKLMVSEKKNEPPLRLIGFKKSIISTDSVTYKAVQIMTENSRPMLTAR